jgi:hypothetical protein
VDAWRPLSRRGSTASVEALHEGVPNHLRDALVEWLRRHLDLRMAGEVRLILRLEDALLVRTPNSHALAPWVGLDSDHCLDVIDAVLHLTAERAGGLVDISGPDWFRAPRDLERVLVLGGSAWRVAEDGRSLERRVDETVTLAAAEAAPAGTSAAEHLAAAWRLPTAVSQIPAMPMARRSRLWRRLPLLLSRPGTVERRWEPSSAIWRMRPIIGGLPLLMAEPTPAALPRLSLCCGCCGRDRPTATAESIRHSP